MNPSPEQVEKWRKEFVDFGWSAYLRVKTEQATEIVELKAKLAGAEAEIAALKQGLRRADEKAGRSDAACEVWSANSHQRNTHKSVANA